MRRVSLKIILSLVLVFLSFISCTPSDDDDTPLIFSSYNEGAFSIGIFEVKIDSTFRFWRNLHSREDEINGTWELNNDTFDLFVSDNKEKKGGRLYLQKRYRNGIPYYAPHFNCLDTSLILMDLTISNFRLALIQHNPPRNIDFDVSRSKPKKLSERKVRK
jgi:hypothetical protein